MASEILTLRRRAAPRRLEPALWGALLLWWALVALMVTVPDKPQGFAAPRFVNETHQLFIALAALLTLLVLAASATPARSLWQPLKRSGRWLMALALLIGVWETVTAKLALLPAPFFAPPRALIEAYATDWPRLLDSVLNSLRLLAFGFLYGSVVGFVTDRKSVV